jgi:CHAT domain-containing protein
MSSSFLSLAGEHLMIDDLAGALRSARPRLVTLSACETGLVDFHDLARANLGMASQLRDAGAAVVLSSLWPVSDASTFLLMKRFYEEHRAGTALPLALARAQSWLRDLDSRSAERLLGKKPETASAMTNRPFSSPFYWAAFYLNGL